MFQQYFGMLRFFRIPSLRAVEVAALTSELEGSQCVPGILHKMRTCVAVMLSQSQFSPHGTSRG